MPDWQTLSTGPGGGSTLFADSRSGVVGNKSGGRLCCLDGGTASPPSKTEVLYLMRCCNPPELSTHIRCIASIPEAAIDDYPRLTALRVTRCLAIPVCCAMQRRDAVKVVRGRGLPGDCSQACSSISTTGPGWMRSAMLYTRAQSCCLFFVPV